MEKVTPTLSNMPKSYGDHDKLGAAMVRLEALDSKIAADIKKLTDVLTVNRMLIDSVDSYNQRIILTKRYVNFGHWEDIAMICIVAGIAYTDGIEKHWNIWQNIVHHRTKLCAEIVM